MMIKESADTTSNISSCFLHLVTFMLSECIVRVSVDATEGNSIRLVRSQSINVIGRNDINCIQFTLILLVDHRTEKRWLVCSLRAVPHDMPPPLY